MIRVNHSSVNQLNPELFISDEQAQKKKRRIVLPLSKEMMTYASDDESLKRLVAHHQVFFDKRSGKAERFEGIL